jgi:small subunit ribosomal protein S18
MTVREMEQRGQLSQETSALANQMKRQWKAGDVYAPHDLSSAEARKWGDRHPPTTDAFDALSINPLTLYKASLASLCIFWLS